MPSRQQVTRDSLHVQYQSSPTRQRAVEFCQTSPQNPFYTEQEEDHAETHDCCVHVTSFDAGEQAFGTGSSPERFLYATGPDGQFGLQAFKSSPRAGTGSMYQKLAQEIRKESQQFIVHDRQTKNFSPMKDDILVKGVGRLSKMSQEQIKPVKKVNPYDCFHQSGDQRKRALNGLQNESFAQGDDNPNRAYQSPQRSNHRKRQNNDKLFFSNQVNKNFAKSDCKCQTLSRSQIPINHKVKGFREHCLEEKYAEYNTQQPQCETEQSERSELQNNYRPRAHVTVEETDRSADEGGVIWPSQQQHQPTNKSKSQNPTVPRLNYQKDKNGVLYANQGAYQNPSALYQQVRPLPQNINGQRFDESDPKVLLHYYQNKFNLNQSQQEFQYMRSAGRKFQPDYNNGQFTHFDESQFQSLNQTFVKDLGCLPLNQVQSKYASMGHAGVGVGQQFCHNVHLDRDYGQLTLTNYNVIPREQRASATYKWEAAIFLQRLLRGKMVRDRLGDTLKFYRFAKRVEKVALTRQLISGMRDAYMNVKCTKQVFLVKYINACALRIQRAYRGYRVRSITLPIRWQLREKRALLAALANGWRIRRIFRTKEVQQRVQQIREFEREERDLADEDDQSREKQNLIQGLRMSRENTIIKLIHLIMKMEENGLWLTYKRVENADTYLKTSAHRPESVKWPSQTQEENRPKTTEPRQARHRRNRDDVADEGHYGLNIKVQPQNTIGSATKGLSPTRPARQWPKRQERVSMPTKYTEDVSQYAKPHIVTKTGVGFKSAYSHNFVHVHPDRNNQCVNGCCLKNDGDAERSDRKCCEQTQYHKGCSSKSNLSANSPDRLYTVTANNRVEPNFHSSCYQDKARDLFKARMKYDPMASAQKSKKPNTRGHQSEYSQQNLNRSQDLNQNLHRIKKIQEKYRQQPESSTGLRRFDQISNQIQANSIGQLDQVSSMLREQKDQREKKPFSFTNSRSGGLAASPSENQLSARKPFGVGDNDAPVWSGKYAHGLDSGRQGPVDRSKRQTPAFYESLPTHPTANDQNRISFPQRRYPAEEHYLTPQNLNRSTMPAQNNYMDPLDSFRCQQTDPLADDGRQTEIAKPGQFKTGDEVDKGGEDSDRLSKDASTAAKSQLTNSMSFTKTTAKKPSPRQSIFSKNTDVAMDNAKYQTPSALMSPPNDEESDKAGESNVKRFEKSTKRFRQNPARSGCSPVKNIEPTSDGEDNANLFDTKPKKHSRNPSVAQNNSQPKSAAHSSINDIGQASDGSRNSNNSRASKDADLKDRPKSLKSHGPGSRGDGDGPGSRKSHGPGSRGDGDGDGDGPESRKSHGLGSRGNNDGPGSRKSHGLGSRGDGDGPESRKSYGPSSRGEGNGPESRKSHGPGSRGDGDGPGSRKSHGPGSRGDGDGPESRKSHGPNSRGDGDGPESRKSHGPNSRGDGDGLESRKSHGPGSRGDGDGPGSRKSHGPGSRGDGDGPESRKSHGPNSRGDGDGPESRKSHGPNSRGDGDGPGSRKSHGPGSRGDGNGPESRKFNGPGSRGDGDGPESRKSHGPNSRGDGDGPESRKSHGPNSRGDSDGPGSRKSHGPGSRGDGNGPESRKFNGPGSRGDGDGPESRKSHGPGSRKSQGSGKGRDPTEDHKSGNTSSGIKKLALYGKDSPDKSTSSTALGIKPYQSSGRRSRGNKSDRRGTSEGDDQTPAGTCSSCGDPLPGNDFKPYSKNTGSLAGDNDPYGRGGASQHNNISRPKSKASDSKPGANDPFGRSGTSKPDDNTPSNIKTGGSKPSADDPYGRSAQEQAKPEEKCPKCLQAESKPGATSKLFGKLGGRDSKKNGPLGAKNDRDARDYLNNPTDKDADTEVNDTIEMFDQPEGFDSSSPSPSKLPGASAKGKGKKTKPSDTQSQASLKSKASSTKFGPSTQGKKKQPSTLSKSPKKVSKKPVTQLRTEASPQRTRQRQQDQDSPSAGPRYQSPIATKAPQHKDHMGGMSIQHEPIFKDREGSCDKYCTACNRFRNQISPYNKNVAKLNTSDVKGLFNKSAKSKKN